MFLYLEMFSGVFGNPAMVRPAENGVNDFRTHCIDPALTSAKLLSEFGIAKSSSI
jgi:hypothetical protein